MAGPKTGRRSAGRAGSTSVCPDRRVLLLPDAAFDPAEVHYAAVWKPHPGELAAFPNLRVIFNLGAGVDALMADRSLPDVPLVRVAVTDLTARMTEYVVLHVLMHHRQELYLRESPARKALGAEICNGRRARSRSASWGWARSAPTRPTRSSASAFASRAGAAARRRSTASIAFTAKPQLERVPAADRHPGLPAAADAGDAAHSQPRRCSGN